MKFIFPIILCTSLHTVFAAHEVDAPSQVPNKSEPKTRWSLALGTRARNFRSNFNMGAITPSGFSLTNNVPFNTGGKGDIGFFTGGAGSVVYDDGSVGPAYGTQPGNFGPDGSAYGTINSPSQLTTTGRFDSQQNEIFDLSFHTTSATGQSSSGYTPGGFKSSDSTSVAAPFIEIRYSIHDGPKWGLNLVGGYSWAEASLNSGTGNLGTAFNLNTLSTTNYTYTYDHFGFNSGAIGANSPFQDTQSATIFDAAVANAPNGYTQNTNDSQAPRKSVSQSLNNVNQVYLARGSANLHVNFHEITIAAELVFHLKDRLHITISGGPTFNVIDASLTTTGAWYAGGTKLATVSTQAKKTNIEAGVMGQAGVTYDISKRWFVEISGGYRYVSELNISAGNSTVRLDPSTWAGGIATGFRF